MGVFGQDRIEGADGTNPRVHTEADTLGVVDRDLAMEILRMNVAYVAETLRGGLSEPPAPR